MRGYKRLIALSVCSILLSVSAIAMPIDVTQFDMMVPVTITPLGDVATEVSAAEFNVAKPYVVGLAAPQQVPIAEVGESVLLTQIESIDNHPAKQNLNFERQQNL